MNQQVINKLKDYENNLIETDRRNNLINLKENLQSFKVIYPTIDTIYNQLVDNETAAIISIEDVIRKYDEYFSKNNEIVEDDHLSPNDLKNKIEDDGFISNSTYTKFNLSKIINKKEIVLYSSKNKSIDLEKDTTLKKLEELIKKSETYKKERGIHVLHIALGFVKWNESPTSITYNISPLSLMEISINQKSKGSPFTVSSNNSSIILNPILRYKFYQDFGIELSEYSNESIDDYLSILDNEMSRLKDSYNINYEVKKDTYISNFRTDKISMYLDIKNNHELILNNQNILKILGERDDGDYSSIEEENYSEEFYPLLDLHNVVNADSSQIEAILSAKRNESFVLQGPPGTGKSQTITNIIAESLFDGKKVLFVSQKQAALEVVKNNLNKVGLSDFYLDLFDNVSNKDVLSDINNLLNRRHNKSYIVNDDNIREKNLIKDLNEYNNLIHSLDEDTGKSLYDYYGEYYKLNKYPDVDYILSIPINEKKEYLHNVIDYLNSYKAYAKDLGYDYRKNPWYGYKLQDNSLFTKHEVYENINISINAFKDLINHSEYLSNRMNVRINNYNDLLIVNKLIDYLLNNNIILDLDVEKFDETNVDKINKLKDLAIRIKSLSSEIENLYKAEIYLVDYKDLHYKLTQIFDSKLKRITSRKEYKKTIYEISKNRKSTEIDYDDALKIINTLIDYNDMLAEYKSLEEDIVSLLGPDYIGINSDWGQVEFCLDLYEYLNNPNISNILLDTSVNNLLSIVRLDKELVNISKRINSYDEDLELIQNYFNNDIFDIKNTKLRESLFKLELIITEFDNLDNWINFKKLIDSLDRYKILGFVNKVIEKNIPLENIDKLFLKRFYMQVIESKITQSNILNSFNKNIWDKHVEDFRELDKKSFNNNQETIKHRLYQKIPNNTKIKANSKYTFLRKENQKKRKVKSIREILTEAGNEILNIKPCFLVSPLNVSSYLDPQVFKFDLVIFDEASQIFPWEAIGSIYRAKQSIIVGDTMQMPPSDYFRSSVDSDFEENLSEVNDYESILDICTGYFNQIRLNWHYRSKYEELIAFSNKKFYDGNLLTFPSSNPVGKDEGMEFEFVNSKLDSVTNQNIKEAEQVVNLIYEHFKNFPNRSLGVISLNSKHAELIENILDNRRIKEPSFEEFFSDEKNEPFFLKNLETVQGDERDTIIFSIGYALNENGILKRNFGPLSREGGERRLNVAASRAKINMKVVSSIHDYDLKVEDLKYDGARYLRDYLDYAENGTRALDRSINIENYDHFDSPFEQEVCYFLRENGFTVDTQIGVSGYKIDMGLRIEGTTKYLLAIECDGRTYHSSKNARDRDVLRQEILENLGWSFYRIWSTDWYKNNNRAKEDLLIACQQVVNRFNSFAESTLNMEEVNTEELNIIDDTSNGKYDFFFDKYNIINIKDRNIVSRVDFSDENDRNELIDSILYSNSPITKSELFKKINELLNADISSYSLEYILIKYLDERKSDVYLDKNEIFISERVD